MREGSLRVLEDVIFTIDNEGAFNAAVERLRDLICDFKGNPFKDSMSYASSMGARVGVVYDARDEDWNSEIEDDINFPSESGPDLPLLNTVPLPPFGLPSISNRRVPADPVAEPLTQRPERDKVSESVLKKYEKIPP